jgi:putative tryptophan/tyrosine transport system substrate-binding protein
MARGGNLMLVSRTNRRAFIAGLGGAVAWPVVARAQHAGKLPTVGFLAAGTGSDPVWRDWTAAFVQRLRELGWIEGRTVAIEYRWAEARGERFADIASELVRLKVDVIVSSGSAAVAVKRATSVIPIVFPTANEPVGSGLVETLARPGGNATGLSMQQTDLAGKRLELLRELVPNLRRLAILINAGNPGAMLDRDQVREAADTLGVQVDVQEIRRSDEITLAFEALKGRTDALYVVGDALMSTNRVRINMMALAQRLPSMFPNRASVEAGGLVSYGPNFPDLYRRAGDYVDKILRGAKPASLPVEQPTKFDLVVNLTTARLLGLAVPPMLLARTDEVIE